MHMKRTATVLVSSLACSGLLLAVGASPAAADHGPGHLSRAAASPQSPKLVITKTTGFMTDSLEAADDNKFTEGEVKALRKKLAGVEKTLSAAEKTPHTRAMAPDTVKLRTKAMTDYRVTSKAFLAQAEEAEEADLGMALTELVEATSNVLVALVRTVLPLADTAALPKLPGVGDVAGGDTGDVTGELPIGKLPTDKLPVEKLPIG